MKFTSIMLKYSKLEDLKGDEAVVAGEVAEDREIGRAELGRSECLGTYWPCPSSSFYFVEILPRE